MTRPARIAARRTSSLSTESSSTRRTAPPRPRTPSRRRGASPLAVRSPSTRTTSRRAPLVASSSTVPADHQAAVVDDGHLLAQVLDLVELMAARTARSTPAVRLLDEHLADRVDARRVEARERLVQDEHLRVVHEGRGQLHPLLVAVESASTFGSRRSAIPSRSSHDGRRRGVRRRHAVQPSEVLDLLTDEHSRVQAALFGHVAEPSPLGWPTGTPFQVTEPASRSVSPKMARIVVVLPAPFGPRKPTTCPAGTWKERSARAVTLPYVRPEPLELEQCAHTSRLLHPWCRPAPRSRQARLMPADQPRSSSLASRAPSAMAPSFAQVILGSTVRNEAKVAKPQSLPASTLSVPTRRA